MKYFLFSVFVLISGFAVAQTSERIEVDGKIIVPKEMTPEGIQIYNKNSGKGTVVSEKGTFELYMKAEDTLIFTALQYQEMELEITQEIIKNGYLEAEISEKMNQLAELVLHAPNLSGLVEQDLSEIKVKKANLPSMSAAEIKSSGQIFTPDAQTSPENTVMGNKKGAGLNGLFIIGKLVSLVLPDKKSQKPPKQVSRSQYQKIQLEEKLRKRYDETFFEEQFRIPKVEISNFLWFSEAGLTESMLKKEKELDLLQYLFDQSQEFRNQNP